MRTLERESFGALKVLRAECCEELLEGGHGHAGRRGLVWSSWHVAAVVCFYSSVSELSYSNRSQLIFSVQYPIRNE